MAVDSIIFELTLIIVGAAALGTLFLYARQPIIIAYIALGIIVGPSGLSLINRTDHIEQISHLGIVLLLFLIGLNLQPAKLIGLFRQTALLTFATSILFAGIAAGFALLLGFSAHNALIFGAAMMFSSTVIGLKLIPTTTLHQKHIGEVMTSVLLLQDMLAILVILYIAGEKSDQIYITFSLLAGKLILLCLFAFGGVRYVMIPLLTKFDVVQEYTFLATLGWCLLWAETANVFGLSYEIGAFVAGISIASCQIALAIADHLKPLREFFLILFFFAVGSNLNLSIEPILLISAILFGIAFVPLKIAVFRIAFKMSGEPAPLSKEISARLGQSSEFSILVAFSALTAGSLTADEAMIIQIATITTFIISTYWVVLKYPTPISESSNLRQD